MSYILDALRRADAERDRGAVPGLHAQAMPADPEPGARDRRPVWWAAGGAALVAAVVVAVLALGPWRAANPPIAAVPAPSTAPVTVATAPVPATTPTGTVAEAPPPQGESPAAQAGALAPAARPVAPPLARARDAGSPPAGVAPRPAAAVAAERQEARLDQRVAEGRVGVLAAGADAARPATAPAPAGRQPPYQAATAAAASTLDAPVEHYGPPVTTRPAQNTVVPLAQLPADVRAGLPRLTPGGAIYSDAASERMLILNGQVWHEGDHPAADTTLEQIRHKSAVLNFRGQRYEITF